MGSNSRFDSSLSSPDGPSYSNGQRGSYSSAARDNSDHIPGTSKSNASSSQGDMSGLLLSLASDLKVIAADHRVNRSGEMRRAMCSIFGASSDDISFTSLSTKPFSSSFLEEIKRLKNNLHDNFTKARVKAITFGDAISKVDKLCHNISKKRSRVDSSSGERTTGLYHGSTLKTGQQSHLFGCVPETVSQRLEEKAKISVPNRKIRTSLVEANVATRSAGSLEREKDISKQTSSSATQGEEANRVFSTAVDGWERSRMKKKRSVIKSDASTSSGLVKSLGDRETKRGIQQKLGIDARPKVNNSQNIRSGSGNYTALVGKADSSIQQNSPSMRSRNEQNNVMITNDRRDSRFCPDTESASHRVISRHNNQEDNYATSSALSKFGSARGPRSNSGSLSKASPSIHRVVVNSEDTEPPQPHGVINRKRSASLRSSSPPLGQWAVQRPQKNSRTSRRSSLSPLISSHDDLSVSETAEDGPINHDDFTGTKRASSIASQHYKMRGDNFASTSLSESEEFGVHENKSNDKVKKCIDIESKPVQTVQKLTNLAMPSRKNRMTVNEDCGDAYRKQGRMGRGFTSSRSCMPSTIEKLGDVVTAKQQRSVRHGSERVESKPGRPPIKFSERKNCARPRQLISNASLESSDEATDDHEELVAAATAALDTVRRCSGTLWKQVETLFRFVSTEDTAFLRDQIECTNESAAKTNEAREDIQNIKIDPEHVLKSSATVAKSKGESNTFSNGVNFYGCEREAFTKEKVGSDPLLEHFVPQNGPDSGISICQALLSAFIGEDDCDNLCNSINYNKAYSHIDSHSALCDFEKDLKTKALNCQPQEDCEINGRKLGNHKADSNRAFHYQISQDKLGPNGAVGTVNKPLSSIYQPFNQPATNQTTPSSSTCTEFHYSQMSINDRLMLELSAIGLYPEAVPDLTYDEGEDIMKSIHALEEKLQEQAANRRNLLLKLEKSVADCFGHQHKKLEHLAMDRLVQMAYDRYMACRGPNAAGNKNANRIARNAAQAFIKRTLARCKKFKETNTSCFKEPSFKDIFLSASASRNNHFQAMGIRTDGSQNSRRAEERDPKFCKSIGTINANGHPPFRKEETHSSSSKKKEILLDDVVENSPGLPSGTVGLESSLPSSTKGKRSERDRDGKVHNRDHPVLKNATTKLGRPPIPSCAGERKTRTKPKAKTTMTAALQSSAPPASISQGVLTGRGRPKEKEDPSLLPGPSETKKLSNDSESIDLNNVQLPDMDVDFGEQGQDIASWLNFEEEGMQDQDFMGLEIPMDDLSDVHMMI